MNSSDLHKIISLISLSKDLEVLDSGNKKKIVKRAKNKIKGKALNKVLNKVNFWSK
jgi:hypothetical protein